MSETQSAAETELVFIPIPTISHLISSLQVAKLLTDADHRLAVTFLIMKLPMDFKIDSFVKNSTGPRISFVQLPHDDAVLRDLMKDWKTFMKNLIRLQNGPVRDYVVDRRLHSPAKIAGFVIDMFCTPVMDVADEFGIPTYVFFTCSSAMLGLVWHLQKLRDGGVDLKEYEDSDFEMSVPSYVSPVPARVWPSGFFDKEDFFHEMGRRFRTAKGILVNSFQELESHAVDSLSRDETLPPVFPVGPILHFDREESEENKKKHEEVMAWLDDQPDSSVVYICFGSNGSLEPDQVREIAAALEGSGHRFLWSLRKPPPKDQRMGTAGEYEDLSEVLPESLLRLTSDGVGKVIGWAPQVAVLSHKAVGGFVSHCGWNSTLESIWCGVPMAVWPLFAEQQVNAFQLVKELGMAVEIKMDYRKDRNVIVGKEKIERGVRELMENGEIRAKAKELKEKSRAAVDEGGSSYSFLMKWLAGHVMDGIAS